MGRRRCEFDDFDPCLGGPACDKSARKATLVPVRLGGGKRHGRRRDRGRIRSLELAVRRGRNYGKDDAGLGSLLICTLQLFGYVLEFPARAADRTTDPLGRRALCACRLLVEGDLIPEDERIVALHPDARIRPYLGLEDAGCGASTLCQGASAFLEEVQSVESYIV